MKLLSSSQEPDGGFHASRRPENLAGAAEWGLSEKSQYQNRCWNNADKGHPARDDF